MKTTDNIQSLSRNEIAYQDFGQNYLSYINQCKTEWEATEYAENALLQAGFQPLSQWLDNGQRLQPGDKVYAKNRDRGLCAAVIGTEPQAGFQVIGAHLDSPVVFLRPNPVFSRCGFALGSTFSRGGIKPYQWLSIPLAIHGKILKKDGTFQAFTIGERETEPVFYASDLAAHLSGDRRTQPMNQAVSAQDLNIAMGSVAESAAAVDHIDALLREYINISYQDLAYGEVYVVPAIKAREVGLDRSMIAAYGHDDRICVYAGLRALLDMKPSARTAILMCQDKEEIGNLGNTAAASRFYSDFMAELLELQTGTGSGHLLRQVLSDTQAITGDVTFLQEPMDPSQTTAENDGISGRGVCIAPYTSSTLPQYRGGLLRLLDEKQIPWQISTGRPDRIAFSSSTGQSFSKNNIDAIIPR